MTIPPDILQTLKPQAYADVREQVRDGDILLCSARDPFSRLIRWATKSPWSHVALAFRLPHIDRVIVLECVERLGVRAAPLSSFVTRTSSGTTPYPGQILLVRHAALQQRSSDAHLKKIYKFALDRCGAKFAGKEILKIGARIIAGRFVKKMPKSLGPDDEYICSEYVARCFEQIGVQISWDQEGFIAPCDFANDAKIQAVAQIRT